MAPPVTTKTITDENADERPQENVYQASRRVKDGVGMMSRLGMPHRASDFASISVSDDAEKSSTPYNSQTDIEPAFHSKNNSLELTISSEICLNVFSHSEVSVLKTRKSEIEKQDNGNL